MATDAERTTRSRSRCPLLDRVIRSGLRERGRAPWTWGAETLARLRHSHRNRRTARNRRLRHPGRDHVPSPRALCAADRLRLGSSKLTDAPRGYALVDYIESKGVFLGRAVDDVRA